MDTTQTVVRLGRDVEMGVRLAIWSLLAGCLLGVVSEPVLAASDTIDPHVVIQRMARAYDGIRDYTAVFLKRERIKGTLLPLEQIELRFQEPFKVYMAWHKPHAGRAIVYVEGENDNKILVNPGGLLRFIRLTLDPTSALATRHAHHTVREAGLRKTIELLVREYERGMREGQVTLAFQGDDEVDGRPAYHLAFVFHAAKTAGYVAQRGDLWVDTQHFLPIKLSLYDWDNQLYAHYEYQRLRLNPDLGPEAFRLSPVVDAPPLPAQTPESGSP
jgi:outer membrane lipoprotein-sorting protein